MAIFRGVFRLPGLIWFGPLAVKSVWPQTRMPDLVPDAISSIRLLPVSATNTFPAESTFTSNGADRVLADASGLTPGFGVIEAKSLCPSTFLATAPIAGVVGKTKTRLSREIATYKFPELSTATPCGPFSDDD